MPREDLAKKYWSKMADKIYDETYNKTYRDVMANFQEQKPRPWYEAEAQQLATNLAEDAVDEYLIKKSEEYER